MQLRVAARLLVSESVDGGVLVILTLVGGGLGALLGELSGYVFRAKLGWQLAMSPAISAGAIAASLAVGVVSGMYPAVRASRVDPIVALRTE